MELHKRKKCNSRSGVVGDTLRPRSQDKNAAKAWILSEAERRNVEGGKLSGPQKASIRSEARIFDRERMNMQKKQKQITCRDCGQLFEPYPGKPGYINQCENCTVDVPLKTTRPGWASDDSHWVGLTDEEKEILEVRGENELLDAPLKYERLAVGKVIAVVMTFEDAVEVPYFGMITRITQTELKATFVYDGRVERGALVYRQGTWVDVVAGSLPCSVRLATQKEQKEWAWTVTHCDEALPPELQNYRRP
jgi:hypothetical protein